MGIRAGLEPIALEGFAVGKLHGVSVRQSGVACKDGDAVILFQEGHAVAQLLGHGVLPLDDLGIVEGQLTHVDAEGSAVFGVVIDVGGVQQGLGGDAAPIQAGAAQLRLLHQGGLQAVLAEADGTLIASGAAAHNDCVKFLHTGLLKSAARGFADSSSTSAGTWRPRRRR